MIWAFDGVEGPVSPGVVILVFHQGRGRCWG